MKKIILALLLGFTLISSTSYADKAQFMRDMAHANPVPNYMSFIKKNADKLALNKDQMQKVMVWKKKNGPQMVVMVNSVIDAEKEIKMASINGISASEISVMSNKLMDTRKKIIAGKTGCRDYMMNVLNDKQWKQLTDIIKAK